jgi:hypothetical protein
MLAYMSEDRTTVYLERNSYRALKQLARDRGVSAASLVREAVSEYAARHAPRRAPRSVGVFSTDDPRLASRAEDLLEGMGEDRS